MYWVCGDVAHTRNSQAAFFSSSLAYLLMPMPVPPKMFALLTFPFGRIVQPTFPATLDFSPLSNMAENSCHSGAMAISPAAKASANPFQSQEVLPGAASFNSLL